ncbi:MAG: PSD1 and planctomycete cytochrome C domain-containing protein [Planctomycetota bacterium]|nr:PSD1 and planctomycete cytochrome C domain-containing protein [Planctomycetota bacterium]MDA1250802.1 PSD1 and planctomycete cytochrome C domain-containing protein [Planctomycetota bacterium]
MRSPALVAVLVIASSFRAPIAEDELPPAVDRKVDFVKDVKPLFAKHCLSCHGSEKQEAGFRLDMQAAALAGGDGGASILPENSADSLLIRYVAGIDENIVMPPKGDQLTKTQVGILRAWIDQGATWPEPDDAGTKKNSHWSYQPVVRPKEPVVKNKAWARNSIDAFVLARLEEKGIAPSAEADRRTLIRRVYFDLLGLPPEPIAVEAFLNDKSKDAYENLVDSLLQSPHFGERWGRHWLDMARYADSDGYEKDNARPNAWRWRNWVIDAINRDLPFDQFTIEQLAGDLLPDATVDQKLATAFHRQTLTNTEGGTDQEQFRIEACFDRTETTSTVWLGLTVGCARCHSHKYDEISQREYYQIFAFLNNGDESNTNVPTSEEAMKKYEAEKATHDVKLRLLNAELAAAKESLKPALIPWEADFRKRVAETGDKPIGWQTLEFEKLEAASKSRFTRQDDGSYLVEGDVPDTDEYTLTARVVETSQPISAIRVETLTDDRLPSKGPGRTPHGNFVLSDLRVYFGGKKELAKDDAVKLVSGTADFSQAMFPAQNAIDGDPMKTGWAISPQMSKPHHADFMTEKPLTTRGENWIQVVLDQKYGGQHSIGKFRVQVRAGSDPKDGIPKNVLAALDIDPADRKPEQSQEILDWFATVHEATKKVVASVEAHQKAAPKEPVMSVRVINQRKANPRMTYVLRRGEFLQPIKELEIIPAGLGTLNPLKPREKIGDRLDLATWIVSPENPLTSRVTVNYVWKHLFGQGIVRTVNDFGVRGEKPSHPKLLDWLADEFRGNLGWSRKELIRLIVTSATYRQSSTHRSELLEVDPRNSLLARQNRLRAEAEIIRDFSLSVSGLLSKKIGGPSVFPPLPPGVTELSYAGNFKWNTSQGEDQFRRGMYTFFKRTSPHPNLTTFDCPDANTTCVDRQTSNTPLQALILLNNVVFTEAAQSLGKQILEVKNLSDKERLNLAFESCVSRPMAGSEAGQFASLLDASRQWYEAHPDDAKKLVGSYVVEGTSPAESAAWTATCRVMLNMDEFITRN